MQSGTELGTNGQTDSLVDNPITKRPRQTFQAGGIKIQGKIILFKITALLSTGCPISHSQRI